MKFYVVYNKVMAYRKRRSYGKGRLGKRKTLRRMVRTIKLRKRAKVLAKRHKRYDTRIEKYPYVAKSLVPLAPTITLTDLKTIQLVVSTQYNLNASQSVDLRLQGYAYTHKYYKLKKVIFTVEPAYNNAIPNSTGVVQGQILMIPLHDSGDIVESGLGTGTMTMTNIERWSSMNHAKWVKFRNGQFEKTSLAVTPNTQEYAYINPSWGVVGSSSQARVKYGNWFSTRDYDGGTFGISSIIHYGFALFFAGWSIPAATPTVQFKLTRREVWCFKGYDAQTLIPSFGALRAEEKEVEVERPVLMRVMNVQTGDCKTYYSDSEVQLGQ